MKNLRLNLKQKNTNMAESLRSDEFSFNSGQLDQESSKIQADAKELIERTRRMMENLDMDKLKEQSAGKQSQRKKQTRPRSPTRRDKAQHLSLSSRSHIKSMSPSSRVRHCTDDDILLRNHLTLNVGNINQSLLDKTKQIKALEKELKEKSNLIGRLHEKANKKNEEIARLNELLAVNLK